MDSVLQAAYNAITSTDAGMHASSTVQESQAHSSDKDADIQPQTTTIGIIYIFVIIVALKSVYMSIVCICLCRNIDKYRFCNVHYQSTTANID